jgi:cytochrome c
MKRLYFYSTVSLVIIIGCRDKISSNNSKSIEDKIEETSEIANVDSLSLFKYWNSFSYDERRGKLLYDNYCAVCHGVSGEGDGFNSYNLNPKPHSFADSLYMTKLSDQIMLKIISSGGRSVNKSIMMPQYAATLTNDEIECIIAYIKTFHQKRLWND